MMLAGFSQKSGKKKIPGEETRPGSLTKRRKETESTGIVCYAQKIPLASIALKYSAQRDILMLENTL